MVFLNPATDDTSADDGWDFRSPRFRDQAAALQRMTGRTLAACRQELFIAEGDAVEAYMVLDQQREPSPPPHPGPR